MELFYMCLVDGTPGCKYKHPNLKLAMVEAERLARRNTKGRFGAGGSRVLQARADTGGMAVCSIYFPPGGNLQYPELRR